jgi:indole-3-glycerol phosphate synthase
VPGSARRSLSCEKTSSSTSIRCGRRARTALAIAESGIHDRADLEQLFDLKYRAALVGTAFLKKGADVALVVGAFDEAVREMAPMVRPNGIAHIANARTA